MKLIMLLLMSFLVSAPAFAETGNCDESKPLSPECLNLELPLIEPIGVSGKS